MLRLCYERNAKPVVSLRIFSSETRRSTLLKFRIDTGADVSVVPRVVLDKLGSIGEGEAVISDYGGHLIRCTFHVVDIHLGKKLFADLEVVASDGETAYLGLDVLSKLKVLLDDPRKMLSIY
jgi:predicted aspartyl protease